MSNVSPLERRPLGLGGPHVSAVGVGTNSFGTKVAIQTVHEVVNTALDLGVNLFDTADIYGRGESERLLGEALRGRRDEALIATKFGMPRGGESPDQHRGSGPYIRSSAEASLQRLGVEVIDLYQMHQPDPTTPIAESLEALDALVREGKVRWIGCSNFPAWQVVNMQWTARSLGLTAFISAQDEYNLLNQSVERDLLPALEHVGMGLLPYYPLASGLLSGKYRTDKPVPDGSRISQSTFTELRSDERRAGTLDGLQAFCDSRGVSLLEVAISSLLRQPLVSSVIAGATSADQVRANVKAGSWEASPTDWLEIESITRSS